MTATDNGSPQLSTLAPVGLVKAANTDVPVIATTGTGNTVKVTPGDGKGANVSLIVNEGSSGNFATITASDADPTSWAA